MALRPRSRGDRRRRLLLVCGALACAFVMGGAAAQPCSTALPSPAALAASAAAGGEKFRLIGQLCPTLPAPGPVRRAAQLDLDDAGASVTIAMTAPPVPEASTEAATPAPISAAPPDRNAARVLSLAPAMIAAAREHDLDPLLLHAIAHVESRHNPRAVSPVGARGVMQVMPATARRFGVDNPEHSLFDADTNLRASAALLRTLRKRYGDDLRLVLAAYNAGEGAVAKFGGNVPPYPETQAYVRDVLAVYRRLAKSFTVSAAGTLVARGVTP